MNSDREVVDVLEDILKNQEIQLQRQNEALEIQRKQFEMFKVQYERAERLQDRAEAMQDSGARLMGAARKSFIVILPIIFILIAYLTWLIFR